MFLVAGSAVLKKDPKGPKIEESHLISIDYAFKCQQRVRVMFCCCGAPQLVCECECVVKANPVASVPLYHTQ